MNRSVRIVLAAGLALASIAAAPPRSAVTRSAVDLRASASLQAPVLTRIPRQRRVRVQTCDVHWCNVTYRNRQGFVPASVLKEPPARASRSRRCGRDLYVNARGQCVHKPGPAVDGRAPLNATGRCWDGMYSYSTDPRGRCSGHGGTADAGAVAYVSGRLWASTLAVLARPASGAPLLAGAVNEGSPQAPGWSRPGD